jgi:bifunctional non-homologous end joining protein LigD
VAEVKFDGYRIQAHLINGVARLFSRNAIDLSNKFPNLLFELEKFPVDDAIFDGEIVALDEKGRSHFQLLQNSIKSKVDKNLRYYIFDLLYLNGFDLRDSPLLERKEKLKSLFPKKSKYILFSDHIEDAGEDFYQLACKHKLEGVVLKLRDSPYFSGRNRFWVKLKCSLRQEFVIGGWTEPKGGRSYLGSLLLGVYEEGKLKYVGRVGTGFSVASLKEISQELQKIEINESPFQDLSKKSGVHWVKPIKVCEVSFSNWTNQNILRAPVFLGMRIDKKAKSIQKESLLSTKQNNTFKEISSPEKILYKKEKISKIDILNYYEFISEFILPHIAYRPLSLVRCPNGTSSPCFFQKHVTNNSKNHFHSFKIKGPFEDGSYFTISNKNGLKELIQLNAFEIHVWNCHQQSYLKPDQIVLDLDPGPGVKWSQVVQASKEIKKLLIDLDLKSFVKLTGGKGLHIHIPIAPLYGWDQVKAFSQMIALELVSRKPSLYTANMSKKVRKNKIFIDYLRNGFGATAIAPYSLRAKEISSVAMPVSWSELSRTTSGDEFNLHLAMRKLKMRKKDPWNGFLKLNQRVVILDNLGLQT